MPGVAYVDTEDTQREIINTLGSNSVDVKIEMPCNSAYENKYGPFFIPVSARIPEGNRITWEDHDFIAHTTTAIDPPFDSGPVGPGQSCSIIPKEEGMMPYFCKIHPRMQGIVTTY
jgi:plastocyanin